MFFWHIYKTQCAYITIKNKLVKSYKIFMITVQWFSTPHSVSQGVSQTRADS